MNCFVFLEIKLFKWKLSDLLETETLKEKLND